MAVVRLTEDYLIKHMWQTKPLKASWTMDLDREEGPRNGKGPSAHVYFVDGVGKTMKEWSEASGISAKSIRSRLKAGCTFKDAISRPLMSRRPKQQEPRKVRCNAREYELDGQSKTIAAWAAHHGVSSMGLRRRLDTGMTVAEAVAVIKSDRSQVYFVDGVGKTVKEWAKVIGIKEASIYARLRRGWTIEAAVKLSLSTGYGIGRRGWSETSEKAAGTSGGGSPDSQPKQAFFLEAAE